MPLGKYPDWNSCIKDQIKKGKSKESANKICGFLEKKSKGELTEEELTRAKAEIWFESILNE